MLAAITPKIIVRTSDRTSFKRCRRQWGWSSGLKANLEPTIKASPLWLGSAVHYCLEDFHGYNVYKSPTIALKAYYQAHKKSRLSFPDDIKEDLELGYGMMNHYVAWLKGRRKLKTYVYKGVPQVEVMFHIPVPIPDMWKHLYKPGEVIYQGEIDRIIIDEDGQLWIVEYKTARQFEHGHFQTDPQVTVYCWAANTLYPKPIAGVVYQQHKKIVPDSPRILSSGKLSTAENMSTTHRLYREALINTYGSVKRAPDKYIDYLNYRAQLESEDHDPFIRRDWISRSDHFMEAEGVKIMLELEDILNPDLPLYPNPTRDCSWCSFNSICVSMDDGSDWETELYDTMQSRIDRTKENTRWRKNLPPLDTLLA